MSIIVYIIYIHLLLSVSSSLIDVTNVKLVKLGTLENDNVVSISECDEVNQST